MRCGWIGLIVALAGCDQVFSLDRDDLPAGDWASVASGDRHTCGIKLDGTLWCWGANTHGQLGIDAVDAEDPIQPEAAVPTQVGAETWSVVAAGFDHTCALDTSGGLWCWGNNDGGQLGIGGFDARNRPTRVGTGRWTQLVAARSATCAIDDARQLWCWGDNTWGNLGRDETVQRWLEMPTQVAGTDWESITLAYEHACGIRAGNQLWCWGDNFYGQLADPNAPSSSSPRQATGAWSDVAVGDYFTCAIRADGALRCWGYNSSGQLGNGTTTESKLGVTVGANVLDWVDVTAGRENACASRRDGTLACWGDNSRGQIASDTIGAVASNPVPISSRASGWDRVAVGTAHLCLIDGRHHLWCVGRAADGQLGRDTPSRLVPRQVPGTWSTVRAAGRSTCALDTTGEVSCWGDNDFDQLGDGTAQDQQAPAPLFTPGPWDDVMVGAVTACARRGAARWCWGYGYDGEFGNGKRESFAIPYEIQDGHWPQAATTHMCGVDQGRLWCWGTNGSGQAGAGGDPQVDPVMMPDSTWTRVGVGTSHSCGIKLGAVFCWGSNDYGELGNGVGTSTPTPTQVTALATPVDEVFVGGGGTCALRGGSAWCWGYNVGGQLGVPDGAPVTPTQIAGTWTQLALGERHSCGIGTDGSLWCWGDGSTGALGQGTLEDQPVPAQVGTTTHWAAVTVGDSHTCALTTDRTAWCWGDDREGQLGLGTAWTNELVLVP